MLIRDIMRRRVKTVGSNQSIRDTAEIMEEAEVGCLPVVDAGRPVGMITDRDIAVRVDGFGKDPMFTRVADVMSRKFVCCHADQDMDDVLHTMFEENVHRMPVVSRDGEALIGIVSLEDLAAAALDNRFVGMILARGAHAPEEAA